MDLSNLSLKEKVGQKFMFGVNSNNVNIIIDLIKNYHIGGVILYKKNYHNYDEMLSFIKKLKIANKENKIPLFIAIDQEGGRVNRMPSEIRNIKNIYDMSKKDKDLIYKNGCIVGKMLNETGINMNFAPVLDMCDNKEKTVLYNRCFYGNIDDINDVSTKYVKGLKENNVISVIKHFPGHGSSKIDSHFITPYVFDSKKILNNHIKPFEYSIENGIDALMVSHLVVRGMSGGLPASISNSFIDKYIRSKFNGLVITDEINMLSRNVFYKFNYVKHLVNSGSDIILVKIKNNKDINLIDKYINYLGNNKEYVEILDNSVKRIINIKEKYNISDDVSYNGCNINDINNEIDKINNLCLWVNAIF